MLGCRRGARAVTDVAFAARLPLWSFSDGLFCGSDGAIPSAEEAFRGGAYRASSVRSSFD